MLITTANLVEFNPGKKSHRLAVKAFLKRNAWVDSPIRFRDDPQYNNIVEQVQMKLVNWYLEKETSK